MFLRVRTPSALTPNYHPSLSIAYLRSYSKTIFSHSPSFNGRSPPFYPSLTRRRDRCRFLRSRCTLRSCKAFTGNVTPWPDLGGNDESDQYFQALILVPETVKHFNLWKQGFIEETKRHSVTNQHPSKSHRRGADLNTRSIGHGFLMRFQSPTIFLKIACDGDLLLPILVGEFAILRLIDAIAGEKHKERLPGQFQFIENIVKTFGYEVKMVCITDRVVNTYYARIFLRKVADDTNISIDARPSDALHVAERFKAPIYVSREIVLKDAIKVVYGSGRAKSAKFVYDVSLDSAPYEPDSLIEELDLVQKMNEAVSEERFEDAALWRDKLTKLRMPGHEL